LGVRGFAVLCQRIEAADPSIPPAMLPCLTPYLTMIRGLSEAIEDLETRIKARAKADPAMGQLMGIPGIGPLTAHAIVSAIGDGRQFGCARDFAAWVGLTPRQRSSGEKTRSGQIIRQGDQGLRCLLVLGASSVLRQAKARPPKASAWLRGLMARRPVKVAVVAQAAKTARIAWAILTSGESYRAPHDQAGGQAGGQAPLAAAA
jgi:transposase